jgi:TadE-like protein
MMKLRGAGSSGQRGWSGQRGSAAIEAAIVTPLVMALVFGIVELGFLLKDYLAVAEAVRSGVRLASANPRYATFALETANKVALTGQAMNLNDVQQLWVYRVAKQCVGCDPTNKPDGYTDFSGCNICVKFTWVNGQFVKGYDNWPAGDQNACSTSAGGPPDRIGVYLQLKHAPFTGLVFKSVIISEASIMSLEPMSYLSVCKP